MVKEPEVGDVKLAVHLATPRVVDVSVHGEPVMVPEDCVSATVPAGVIAVPAVELSVTVAVQVEAWPKTIGLLHEREVVVERGLIVILGLIELVLLPWTLLNEV